MKEYIYVIMPISSDPEYHTKRDIITRISKMLGLKVHFPFEPNKEYSSNVLSEVSKAFFVLADLSFERPSCYYELGVAQSLGKETFIIAHVDTTIHQIQGDVHYYSDLQQYEDLVKKALTEKKLKTRE